MKLVTMTKQEIYEIAGKFSSLCFYEAILLIILAWKKIDDDVTRV